MYLQQTIDKAFNYIKAATIGNFKIEQLSHFVLDNPRFKLWTSSPSPGKHHYGTGGLVIHTAEVLRFAQSVICDLYESTGQSNMPTPYDIILACVFHDAGKMYDYQPIYTGRKLQTDSDIISQIHPNTDWTVSEHNSKVRHVVRSALIWQEACRTYDYEDTNDEILHAILAHHGRKEWGSPVTPNTRLAWLLHLCDNMSARMDDLGRFE